MCVWGVSLPLRPLGATLPWPRGAFRAWSTLLESVHGGLPRIQ